eukprot:1461054-Rhodomonas_salina.1
MVTHARAEQSVLESAEEEEVRQRQVEEEGSENKQRLEEDEDEDEEEDQDGVVLRKKHSPVSVGGGSSPTRRWAACLMSKELGLKMEGEEEGSKKTAARAEAERTQAGGAWKQQRLGAAQTKAEAEAEGGHGGSRGQQRLGAAGASLTAKPEDEKRDRGGEKERAIRRAEEQRVSGGEEEESLRKEVARLEEELGSARERMEAEAKARMVAEMEVEMEAERGRRQREEAERELAELQRRCRLVNRGPARAVGVACRLDGQRSARALMWGSCGISEAAGALQELAEAKAARARAEAELEESESKRRLEEERERSEST